MYLFHSPFRARQNASNDFYARFTRILQAWTLVIITFFHIGPQVIQQKQQQISKRFSKGEGVVRDAEYGADDDDAFLTSSLLLFPLFFILTHVFMFIHKMKRRWHLGITYLPNLSTLVLNSLLLSVFGALHYEYFSHLYDTEAPCVQWRLLQLLRPFFSVPEVLDRPWEAMARLSAICVFFVVLDYQYKKLRGFDPERGILWAGHYDLKTQWEGRTKVDHVHRPLKPDVDWRELEPPPRSFNSRTGGFRRRRTLDSDSTKDTTSGNESLESSKGSNFFSKSSPTSASALDFLKGDLIYHEDSIDMNTNMTRKMIVSLCEEEGTVMMFRKVVSKLEKTFFAGRHQMRSACLEPQRGNLKQLGGDGYQVPLDARGMSFAPLEMEVKYIQKVKHPINRPGMVPWWSTFVFSTAWQVFANGILKFLSFDVRPIQLMMRPKVFDLSFTSSIDHLSPLFSPSLKSEDESPKSRVDPSDLSTSTPGEESRAVDVWFDWIADIGDGFNSTYEMARLLAQPVITAQLSEAVSLAGDTSCSEGTLDVGGLHRGRDRRVTSSQLHRIGLQRSHSASSPRAFPRAAPAASPMTGKKRSLDDSTGALSRSYRGLSALSKSSTPFRLSYRKRMQRREDVVVLPRGSFVVVGGDLAYPNPNDETYQTRLFEPYSDALGGNRILRRTFFEQQRKIVAEDPEDRDRVHIRMLDAATVARLACADSTLRSDYRSVTGVLRSIPMFFAIPGNHDWFDGLSTFRKYITEKTWIGGWLMPQRSSFFVLKLPYNWFMLCTDTGNEQDIDMSQRNYFLNVIEKYMDDSSCVILATHEPGWLYDAMDKRTEPLQPEVNRVVQHLGARLRLRLAGDIHHYSRHIPKDPLSEAPMLIVSGGGGAFLHGARKDRIISQGTRYIRGCAFPSSNTYVSLLSRLFWFRLINWKFDLILGVHCFGIIFSLLPVPTNVICHCKILDSSEVILPWIMGTIRLISFLVSRAIASLLFVLFSLYCFSIAGSDRREPLYWRILYGLFWTGCVVFASCSVLSMLHVQLVYMSSHGMLLSTATQWRSLIEEQAQMTATALFQYTCGLLGNDSLIAEVLRRMHGAFVESFICRWICVMVRALDPLETLAHYMLKIQSSEIGKFKAGATHREIASYYMHILSFYWIFVTPIVSFIIGCFLLVSVTMFDYMYDSTYSAFQIEDFKHFVRFRIDAETRELHGYVLAKKKVPKVWELDPRHVDQFDDPKTKHTVPHLWQYPSRWCPSVRYGQKPPKTEIIESFTVFPHIANVSCTLAESDGKSPL
ncbi:unnamed protein product [Phytomonas sp. EM1]|nr:unnamed protein product [Phytomonas sp. EM1]|eukprot:CCW59812.1 unnamed protein product [Phytomonas sp. isolate EM1]